MTSNQKRLIVVNELIKRGLSSREVAKAVRISEASATRVLSGESKWLRLETVDSLHDYLFKAPTKNVSDFFDGNRLAAGVTELMLQRRVQELKAQNELMEKIGTVAGFYRMYNNELINNDSVSAFWVVNEKYKDCFGVFRFESYSVFKDKVLDKPLQKPTTLTTAAFKKLVAPQRRFASMRRAVDLVERFYAAGYDDEFKIQNAVLAVHPDAHPVNILCYCDLNFVPWELADVMENALNVLKPGA